MFFSKAPLAMGYVYALEGKLPPESAAALCYAKYVPQWPAGLNRNEKMIPQILRRMPCSSTPSTPWTPSSTW